MVGTDDDPGGVRHDEPEEPDRPGEGRRDPAERGHPDPHHGPGDGDVRAEPAGQVVAQGEGVELAHGQEDDREVHLALNAGLALPEPSGGFYFVFLAGTPAFRKYGPSGELLFERTVQGRELDPVLAAMPQRWPRRTVGDRQLPLVPPVVRTAAVDPEGRLWISFVQPYTYVFDGEGEKVRTVQFRAGSPLAASSLSFTGARRVLVTPGCYEFAY